MLSNAYFLAKIGVDTAEKEQHFAENLPKTGNYGVASRRAVARQEALKHPQTPIWAKIPDASSARFGTTRKMFFSIKYLTLTSGKYLEFPKNLLDLLRLLLSSVAWRAARVAYLLLVH